MKQTSTGVMLIRCCIAIVPGIIATGCSDTVSSIAIQRPPAETLGAFTVAPLVSVIAVNGTETFRADARSLTGTPLLGLDSVRYVLATLSDSLYVAVDQSGKVTAKAASSSTIPINVFGFKNGVVKGEQVYIHVTPTVISGLQFSIQPGPSDSAKIPVGVATRIQARLSNPLTGTSVEGLRVRYQVSPSDAKRLEVYRPTLRLGDIAVTPQYGEVGVDQIRSLDPEGSAWVYGTVRAFGESYRDSVLYSFGYPITLAMNIRRQGLALNVAFHRNGETLTLARGAGLRVVSGLSGQDNAVPDAKLSITFEDPSNIGANNPPSTDGGGSGNIVDLANGKSTRRIFTTPGTYRWSITVKDVPDILAQQRYTGVFVIK